MSDEGLIADSALRTLRGEMLGRDFPEVWGVVSYVVALAFQVIGINLVTMRLVMVSFKIATALILYAGARRLMSPIWALVPFLSVLLLSGPLFKAHTAFSLALLLGAALYWSEAPGRGRAFLVGVAAGFSFLLRPELAALTLVLLASTAVGRRMALRRHALPSGAELAIPALQSWPAAAGGLLAVIAAGGLVVVSMSRQPTAGLMEHPWTTYATEEGLDTLLAERMDPDRAGSLAAIVRLFFYDLKVNALGGFLRLDRMLPSSASPAAWCLEFGLILLAVVPPLMLARFCWCQPSRARFIVLAVTTGSLLKYFSRADAPHLRQHLPFLALTLAYVAWLSRPPPAPETSRHRGPNWPAGVEPKTNSRLPALGMALFVVALTAASVLTEDIYTGGIGVLRQAEVRLEVPTAPVRLCAQRAQELMTLLEAIRSHLGPNEQLLALPYCPMLYLLVNQPGPLSASFDYSRLDAEALSGRAGTYVAQLREVIRKKSIGLVALDLNYRPGQEGVLSEDRFLALLSSLVQNWAIVYDDGRFRLYRVPRT